MEEWRGRYGRVGRVGRRHGGEEREGKWIGEWGRGKICGNDTDIASQLPYNGFPPIQSSIPFSRNLKSIYCLGNQQTEYSKNLFFSGIVWSVSNLEKCYNSTRNIVSFFYSAAIQNKRLPSTHSLELEPAKGSDSVLTDCDI